MNILFNFPSNKRAVSIESLAEAFVQKGHKVIFYSQEPEGLLHQFIARFGVISFFNVFVKKSSVVFYLKHILSLARCIRRNKIDVVFSHTQVANITAVIAQYLCKTRMIICRHHSDSAIINNNFNARIFDKIINLLGREFIAPCKKVFDQMVGEGIKQHKIKLIYYGYNFNLYDLPSPDQIEKIRNKFSAKFLIVKAARLMPEKRHIILFRLIKKLVDEGYDIKCAALSDGPKRNYLEKFIKENDLQDHIYLLGFRSDLMAFLSAADIIVHLSSSEASNNLIKEAGLFKKPVIVCNDVGDFDDYLVNNINSFVINKDHPEIELEELIRKVYNNRVLMENLGKNLNEKVLEIFSIEKVIREYDDYLTKEN